MGFASCTDDRCAHPRAEDISDLHLPFWAKKPKNNPLLTHRVYTDIFLAHCDKAMSEFDDKAAALADSDDKVAQAGEGGMRGGGAQQAHVSCFCASRLNPKPETRNPKPETLNPYHDLDLSRGVFAQQAAGAVTDYTPGGAGDFGVRCASLPCVHESEHTPCACACVRAYVCATVCATV